jgi:hypothetical protein
LSGSNTRLSGHTKNAADRLFNLLKTEYRLQNLFTFQALLEALGRLPMVTIHPTISDDFIDYDKLMRNIYWPLPGKVKKNHIFSCNNVGDRMTLRQSDLAEHTAVSFNLRKKGIWEDMTQDKLAETTNSVLAVTIPNVGLNPYKMVEMYNENLLPFFNLKRYYYLSTYCY